MRVETIDLGTDGPDLLWLGWGPDVSTGDTIGYLYELGGDALADLDVELDASQHPESSSAVSFGCEMVDGALTVVVYDITFSGGSTLEDATTMDVTVRRMRGAPPVDQRTLSLPAEIDAAVKILDPHCGALSVFTEG
jgi:hypothetical protein